MKVLFRKARFLIPKVDVRGDAVAKGHGGGLDTAAITLDYERDCPEHSSGRATVSEAAAVAVAVSGRAGRWTPGGVGRAQSGC